MSYVYFLLGRVFAISIHLSYYCSSPGVVIHACGDAFFDLPRLLTFNYCGSLAREMLAFWAEGNSIASQALSHIRTVKAFGCEEKVIRDYSGANKQALTCGVKDAWGNGLTSALTGYLDLGSGVLILWFGGSLVYSGEMSV